jgi:predicted phosphodiesterase
MYPIRKLVVCLAGDLVHNERVGFQVDLDELEQVLLKQMYDVVIPMLSEMLLTWCTQFDEVEVYAVRGNHGGNGKFASSSFNADTLIALTLRDRFTDQPNIHFNVVTENFYATFKVFKTRFLLLHGDSIKMYLYTPFYGIVQRAVRWFGSIGAFDVMIMGHFHQYLQFQFNNWECMVNGCWVTDDGWVLKTLGMAGSCNQTCFGVHPRGITWRYRLDLDR